MGHIPSSADSTHSSQLTSLVSCILLMLSRHVSKVSHLLFRSWWQV